MNLVPVPKGMCPAFYQFMAAGGHRSDSGEILMIGPSDTATSLLREVYRQVGNSATGFRRHALTPALRDAIRDFLYHDVSVCEHGIREGDWCSKCNAEYKQAIIENTEV